MPTEYRIKSVQTNNFVISNGKEMPGDRVMTLPAPEMKPAETVRSPLVFVLHYF